MIYIEKVREIQKLKKIYVQMFDANPKDERLLTVLDQLRTLDVEIKVIERSVRRITDRQTGSYAKALET